MERGYSTISIIFRLSGQNREVIIFLHRQRVRLYVHDKLCSYFVYPDLQFFYACLPFSHFQPHACEHTSVCCVWGGRCMGVCECGRVCVCVGRGGGGRARAHVLIHNL